MFKTYRFDTKHEAEECFGKTYKESKDLGFINIPECGEKDFLWMVKHARPEDVIRIIKWTRTKNTVQIWEDTESHAMNAIIEWENEDFKWGTEKRYIVDVETVTLDGSFENYIMTGKGDTYNLFESKDFKEARHFFNRKRDSFSESDKDYAYNLCQYSYDPDSEEYDYIDTIASYNYYEYMGDIYEKLSGLDTEEVRWSYENKSIGSAFYVIAEKVLRERLSDDFELAFEIIERSKYYNMKAICEKCNVSYQSWRNFKNGSQRMNSEKLEAIENTMNNI